MTVRELIEKLQGLDPELRVVVYHEMGLDPADSAEEVVEGSERVCLIS